MIDPVLEKSLVLMASAGTGKTFRLTNRYLELAAHAVPLDKVLATTFARKAAGEIQHRILTRCAEACLKDSVLKQMQALMELPDGWGRTQAQELLQRMLRNLQDFEVCTLDSYSHGLLASISLEAGLPPRWSMAERAEEEEMKRQACLQVLEEMSPEEADQVLDQLWQGRSRSGILQGMNDLFSPPLNAFVAIRGAQGAREQWTRLEGNEEPEPAQVKSWEEALRELKIPRNKNGNLNHFWKRSLPKLPELVRARRWKQVLEETIVQNALPGGSGVFGRIPYPHGSQALFRRLALGAALGLLHRLHRSNLMLFRLAHRYAERLEALHREAGLLTFDDVTHTLGPFMQMESLRYRLGPPPHHLLLDEFQDTSVPQWKLVEGAIASAVQADGHSLFCVGDVKQAIYGWREGESGLLRGLSEGFAVRREEMVLSYRSSERILDAVNQVFQDLPDFPSNDLLLPGQLDGIHAWGEDFQKAESAVQLPGSAWLQQVEVQGKDKKGSMLKYTVERIVALHQESPEARIGVLVRRGDAIHPLVLELRRRGIRASGRGTQKLGESIAVQLAVSILRLADHPGDTVSFFHLACSPLAEFLGATFQVDGGGRREAGRLSRILRRRLMADGVSGFFQVLRDRLEEDQLFDGWNRDRFRHMIEQAIRLERRGTRRYRDLALALSETTVADPSEAPIEVMTIHAAKGLEFDAVILPFFPGATSSRGLITRRLEDDQPFHDVSQTPPNVLLGFDKTLDLLVREANRQNMEEDLCVLYVAMTRARQRLEILILPPGKSSKRYFPERFLIDRLQDSMGRERDLDGGQLLWDNCWDPEDGILPFDLEMEPVTSPTPAPACESERSRPIEFREPTTHRSLPRWNPSGQVEEDSISAAALLSTSAKDARDRGTALHLLYEQVAWLEDFHASDQELLHALGRTPLGGQDPMDLLDTFRSSLQLPEVEAILTRPDTDGSVELWRERRFSLRVPDEHGADAVLEGSFDRVHLYGTDGKVTAAEIIDFKSGQVRPGEDLDAKTAAYRGQMQAYRKALAVMTGLDADSIRTKLLFVDVGLVAQP